jgi:hypothetical protein
MTNKGVGLGSARLDSDYGGPGRWKTPQSMPVR